MAFSFVRFVECVFILIDLTEKITAKSTTSTNSTRNFFFLVHMFVLCAMAPVQYSGQMRCYLSNKCTIQGL